MKGFLLLSLCLLLVTLASSIANDLPENLTNETTNSSSLSSVTTKSDNKSGTIQTNDNSPQLSGTNRFPGGTNSSTVTNSTNSPTTGLTQSSGGTNSTTIAPNQTNSSSPQTSVTTQPSGAANSSTTVPTQTNSSSPQTPGTTQPSGAANSSTTVPTQTNSSSPQTPVTTQPSGGANSSITAPTQTNSSSPQTSVTTQPSGAASSATVTSSSNTGPSDPCKLDPCNSPASCVRLNSSSFCLCSEGYYYNKSSSCMKGKTFPGEIGMKVPETDDLKNKTSVEYQNLHNDIVGFFEKAFNKTDFGQTVILKVSKDSLVTSRSVMRDTTNTSVYVSVVNLFAQNTTENATTVASMIQNAIVPNGNVEEYHIQDLCDYYGCVNSSNGCQDGLQCTCKSGLYRLNPQVPHCVAATCSEPCDAQEKKLCLPKDSGVMECGCMAGYQKANGKCEECPFGYSGMDCKDQFQLILTIVGTVAGAFILILLIAFIVSVSSKNKKKSGEEQNLIEDDFHNLRLRSTGISNFGADNSIFPKVKTGIPSQTSNPYANHRSMPRPDY